MGLGMKWVLFILALSLAKSIEAQPIGPPNTPGYYNGSGMRPKIYRYCQDTSTCEQPKWVGLFGSQLIIDTEGDSASNRLAEKFEKTSIIKASALISMPIFLAIGINMMNGDIKNGDGKIDKNKSPHPLSIMVTSMAGVGFVGYVITNVIEGNLLGKIMRVDPRIKPPESTGTGWEFSMNYQKQF